MKQFLSLAVAAAVAAGPMAAPAVSFAQDHSSYRSWDDYCHAKKKQGQRNGAVLGAIAGAVIGSNVAGHGNKTTGTVVGAAGGAAVGSNVGRDMAKAKCDSSGAYWDRGDTYDYRDRDYYHGGGRHADKWYERRGCRWSRDYENRPVRVCPDRHGHYRVAD